MIPRFSILTLLVVITVASVLARLNTIATQTITKPYLAGAQAHPPPYSIREMVISVHHDRGWPLWHTRASNHFAAHNSALYIDGQFGMGEFYSELDYGRLTINAFAWLSILAIAGIASELLIRRLRTLRRSRSSLPSHRAQGVPS